MITKAARLESRPTLRRLLGERWTEQIESLEECGAGVGREEVELEGGNNLHDNTEAEMR